MPVQATLQRSADVNFFMRFIGFGTGLAVRVDIVTALDTNTGDYSSADSTGAPAHTSYDMHGAKNVHGQFKASVGHRHEFEMHCS
jgi:hypothetical protein